MVTDATPAAQPWISGGHFDDIDAQAAQLHGYGQQYQQLSRGPFEGRFRSFAFGAELGIHFETANRELAQAASTPPGRYAACFLDENSPACSLNAGTFAQHHVALCPENRMLEGKTAAGVSICCMDLSMELFPDDAPGLRTARIQGDPARSRQLRELVRSGVGVFGQLESLPDYPAAVRDFKSGVADLIWHIAGRSAEPERRTWRRSSTTRTLQVFRRAREYIQEGLADGISVVALCKAVGVSRRSLEQVFRSMVGMGPALYVRTLQLNRVRRELLSGAGRDVSIGVIAARHGIWHWSRFSNH
jgi:AraC family transcriptional regulator, ethanolamine operon transcriptional activator